MMEPQGEPAGNLKGKFAGLLGAVCSAILSGCLALPLRPGLSSPSPSSQTHHSSLGPFVCFNFPLSHLSFHALFVADSHTLG
jgi:hypothetical protein